MPAEEDSRSVIVTDIRMPFWSMVVFMVKWAIAAIPAIILLATIAAILSFAFAGAFTGLNRTSTAGSLPETSSQSAAQVMPKSNELSGPIADRCKGSYEPEKCMEIERRLLSESPEQRTKRQLELNKKQ